MFLLFLRAFLQCLWPRLYIFTDILELTHLFMHAILICFLGGNCLLVSFQPLWYISRALLTLGNVVFDLFEGTLPITAFIRTPYCHAVNYLKGHQISLHLVFLHFLFADGTIQFLPNISALFELIKPSLDTLQTESVLTLSNKLRIKEYFEA